MGMYIPEKTYTDNPFVDNVLYYAKILALNCVIKDEDEALSYETEASLSNGNTLIACVEGRATYELFPTIPKEILEKYIPIKSNIDLYVEDVDALETYFRTFTDYERVNLFRKISNLARTIYIDHYDVMMHYLTNIDDTWIDDNKPLYESCLTKSATYKDLFDQIPTETMKRIVKQYLNNYNNSDINDMVSSLDAFQEYIDSRIDSTIDTELDNITSAMTAVFISHYEMMIERGYVSKSHNKWYEFIAYESVYNKCKTGNSSYSELYPLFPADELLDSLYSVIGQTTVDSFQLYDGLDILEEYFNSYSLDPEQEKADLSSNMMKKYVECYNPMINKDIYEKCKASQVDYWYLSDYMPKETLKVILNTFIDEITNIEAYEKSKNMLNEYLASISQDKRTEIKKSITNDMMEWYPNNYTELNKYYRALMGQPPLDDNGEPMEDTLKRTYNSTTKSFIDFGTRFTSIIPATAYPESHWDQALCDFDDYDISILEEYGILEQYIAVCKDNNTNDIDGRYDYFNHLGADALDVYTCRKAQKFQLMYVPDVDDTDAKKKFVDIYTVNRDYIIRTVYADGYKYQSDYYDKFMIIFILLNTIMDMLVHIPEYIIDREVFDARCISYMFEAFGIPYYSEIPLKYQRAMLKNLNTLIKYKSSTKNMIDICSIFGFDDVKVFNYYLFKSRNTSLDTGEYVLEENNDISYNIDELYIKNSDGDFSDYNGNHYSKLTDYKDYDESYHIKTISVQEDDGTIKQKVIMNNDVDYYVRDPDDNDNFLSVKDLDYFTSIKASTQPATLKFIRVPIGESLTTYKNDPNYIDGYDEIVTADEGDTWDGGLEHDALAQKILDYEFNAVKSKYISIETVTEMTELAFQVSYFYNMLFDNFYSEDNLTVEVASIKTGHKFRFMDIVCYLFALMYLYDGLEDNIMYSPTQILYVKGYNFSECANEVLKDQKYFQQTDEDSGEPLADDKKYNVFSINDRIAEDGYDYHEAFENYRITAFNLGADIDELEKWLNDNCQMSLEDFVVDDSLTEFSQVITLRSFFSLNNSYYQKDIFKQNLLPLQYNQNINYAFGYKLFRKSLIGDIESVIHGFITTDDGMMAELIDDNSNEVYIMDYTQYIIFNGKKITPYYQYTRQSNGDYYMSSSQPYMKYRNGYERIFDNDINIIRNRDQKCVFAADHFYRKVNGIIEEITEDKYFMDDPYEPGKRILLFGEYYIYDENEWKLNPNNCYVAVVKNGEVSYVLLKDVEDTDDIMVSEEDCFIRHSDGHFIRLSDTDYYVRSEDGNSFVLNEEECFVIADRETEWFDPAANPRVYYMKLSSYYDENSSIIINTTYFVKDKDGNFIPESELIHPTTCYYINPDTGTYSLVIEHIAVYEDYTEPFNITNVLILQEDNTYNELIPDDKNYILVTNPNRVFTYNSDTRYGLALNKLASYDDTSTMIVVFNRYLDETTSSDSFTDEDSVYNPEVTDKVWDENDYFYEDPSYDPDNAVGMNGENKWYYTKPDSTTIQSTEENSESTKIGSGFYLEATSYIGDTELEYGSRYYMSFDVETNFNGRVQISNEVDQDCVKETDREYQVFKETAIHVNQVFTANNKIHPAIKFLIYCYDEFPIHIGDYIVVKNIKFMKSYSDNFIAQDIPSYEKLQELYNTNKAIYNYITTKMAECSDYDTYQIYKKLYDSLMTSEYNKEAFKIGDNQYAKTYTDFLETRDAVLYEKLKYFKSLDTETMQKEIADNIVEVTYAIDEYIDTYSYGYLYSYFPAVSANFIQQYISKVINFFKSWKVHLLGINTIYKFDSKMENTIKVLEDQEYEVTLDDTKHNVFIYDNVKINPIDALSPSGEKYTDLFPDLVRFVLDRKEFCRPHDRVRVISKVENRIRITDNYENMHIIFNNDDIQVTDSNGELIIKSESAGFQEVNENELLMTTDVTEDQVNASQIIDEINHFSKDIFEWREFENE
jgi:hypothetical protein